MLAVPQDPIPSFRKRGDASRLGTWPSRRQPLLSLPGLRGVLFIVCSPCRMYRAREQDFCHFSLLQFLQPLVQGLLNIIQVR